ncbi:hypothetical protein R3P38DRAFT_3210857 [Favolaschia claudopus]|uniref:Uncharacterized protein n=1 Tax=Favolaschia claudopus TaxID=2862362 RepID=A0AAW0AGP4_9AGAR
MRNHCTPLYYASGNYDDTYAVDSDPNGRFHLIGLGHCGAGVFDCPLRANEQIVGFSGAVRRSVKRWGGSGGVEEAWAALCEEHHKGGCPALRLPKGFVEPTPVVRNHVLRTAPASVLPIREPSIVSPLPPTSAFNLPPRRPLTPPGATQTLASPFDLSSASPFSPSTYQWPRSSGTIFSSAFPTSPTASRAPATPRFMARPVAPSSPANLPPVTSSPARPPTASSVLSFTSSDLSNLPSSSPNSSPRSLSEIEYGFDDDDLCPPPVLWGIKGMRCQSWSDPKAAVCAALERGMGPMITLMYSDDETTLEDMHGWAVGIRIGGRPVRDGTVPSSSS